MYGLIPTDADAEISTYVAMFIGTVYRNKDSLSVDDENREISIKHFLQSLFVGFRTEKENVT